MEEVVRDYEKAVEAKRTEIGEYVRQNLIEESFCQLYMPEYRIDEFMEALNLLEKRLQDFKWPRIPLAYVLEKNLSLEREGVGDKRAACG